MLSEQQVKNLIKKKSAETGLSAQQLHSLYAIEQFMKKIASSKDLSDKFILKGGYLLTTILQLESRATADLDWTIAHMKLDKTALEKLKTLITSPDTDGISHFEWVSEEETRVNFLYQGFALRLNFINGKMKTPIFIDLTSGEDLLPTKKQSVRLLFEDGSLDFVTYPIEQILSDKLITTLSYGKQDDSNSRAKDLYDIYVLQKTFPALHLSDVAIAMQKTNTQRDLSIKVEDYDRIIKYLSHSSKQKGFWEKFQQQNSYARKITFEEIFDSIQHLAHELAGLA